MEGSRAMTSQKKHAQVIWTLVKTLIEFNKENKNENESKKMKQMKMKVKMKIKIKIKIKK